MILTGTGSSSISSTRFTDFETLNVNGGTWNTLDPVAFVNGVNVNTGGTLNLGDNLTGDVVVNTGGTLSSGPSVTITGDLTNNGTLEPGGDGTIGTINVTGDLVLGSSGTLIIDASASGADAIVVTGTATVSGDLVVDPDGSLAFGTVYHVVTATGGVTGTFDNHIALDNLVYAVDYSDPNRVSVIVSQDLLNPAGPGLDLSRNQQAVAENFTALGTVVTTGNLLAAGNTLATLMTTDVLAFKRALDSLHLEFHDSTTQSALNNTQKFSNGMLGAMNSCDVQERSLTDPVLPCHGRAPGSSQLWVQQSGGYLDHEPAYGNILYDAWSWQTQIGLDTQVTDMMRVGISGAYGQTTNEVDNLGEAKFSSWDVGAYGRLDLVEVDGMKLFVGGTGSYSFSNHENKRELRPFNEVANSDFDSTSFSGSILAGYATEYRGTEYSGSVGYRYVAAEIEGFTETGAGGLNLIVQDQDIEHSAIFAEFSIGQRIRLSEDTYLTPQVTVGYETRSGDIDRSITSRFQCAPASVASFTVYGQEPDQFFTVAGSLDYQVATGMKSFLSAKTGLSDDTMTYDLAAGLRLEF